MNSAIDLSPRRTHGFLSVGMCILLLLARFVVLDQGAATIALLAIFYLAILVVSRAHLTLVTLHRAWLPLVLGIGMIVLARVLLSAPFPSRTTAIGVLTSLLAGVAEEGLFRGALFARLEPFGRTSAIVVCAAAFALVHVPFYGLAALPIDFGAGLLFGWQRSDAGSWAVPAATHAFANLLAVLP